MKLKRVLSLILAAAMLLSYFPGIAIPVRAADDYNLLVNGSFDQGNAGWANNGIAPVATIGNGVLTISAGKTASGDARTYYAMQLAPGKYQLSFDVKGIPAQYRPYVGVSKNYWTNDYGQYMLYNYNLSDSQWTTVTETFTVPASAADANTGLAPVYVTIWNSNGSYAPVTEMQFDNFAVRKMLKVTATLSNAALSSEITALAQGQGYENTVTASAGFEISKVTVTMGGTEVANAYDAATGMISIPVVTGDLHIQVETAQLLKVTATLSNAALSSEITALAQGQGYENTVTASAGFEISKVTVTMGGAEVANAYDAATGKISIAAVTGDLHIQVETAAIDATNLLVNGTFNQGNTGWSNNGIAPIAVIADGVLTLSTGKTASGDARTYNVMQLAPGTYQLTFDAKGTPAQYRPYVGVSKNYWTNDYGQYFLYNYSLSDSKWTTITETFTVPGSAADANTGLAPIYVTVWNSNTSYAPLTEMQLDNFAVRKLVNVTTELNNAALSSGIATVLHGQSYVNTVTANAGYEISKVTVTMGGTEVVNAYDAATGKISIAAVTGDLNIKVETVKLLNVTANLRNATLSSEIATVAQGQSYENTVTASAGYEVSKVTVTMGGTEVVNAYDAATGKISITAVTGDLHIQVETVAIDASNLLVNGSFNQGETGWGKNANFTAGSVKDGVLVLHATKTSGDAIFYQSMNLTPGTYQLTFDGKGTANQYRPLLYIGINQWSKVYGEHFLKNFGFGENWKTATVTFTIPESAANANTGLAPVYVALWTSNGSYAPETEMQFDNFAVRKLLNVTTNLSNAALSEEISTVLQGKSYVNTVTANAGYEISKVTVTMGGTEVANAYDAATGKISITAVTGDLHIQVETVAIDPTNLLVNGSFDQGNAGWANNGIAPVATIGNGVLTISAGKTASGDARTYYAMQLAPGKYQLSFDVKGIPAQYRPYVGVSKNYWTNDYGQYMLYNYNLSDSQWTTVTETFTVPASAADANTGLAPVYVTIWNSNGSYAPVTEMQFDNFAVRKMLKVTANLSNAALSAKITEVAQGLAYENTVIAAEGFEVSKVTVTMGGTEVANAYDAATGKISIAAVTGELNIQVETAPKNLFANGSFDQGNAGWANNGITPVATIADGVLTISTGKTASGDARTYNEMQLAPGTYRLSFDVKGTPSKYRPYVGVSKNYWTNDYGQYFMIDYNLSDTAWTTITETFTVPASAADATTGLAPVYVTIWNSNGSYAPVTEMQFDNFALWKLLDVTTELNNATLSKDIKTVEPGDSYENTVTVKEGYEITRVTVTMGGAEVTDAYDAATGKISIPVVNGDLHIQVKTLAIAGNNLLVNGGFDQGNTGWANNGIVPAAAIADGVMTLPTQKTASGDARTYNAMQLAPGTYQLSFDVKGTPSEYRPYISVSKNYWTNDYGQYFMYQYGLSDTAWTTVTEIFTVPESAADANTGLAPVYVTIWNSNGSYAPETEMYFDNFEVYECFDVTLQNPDGKEATGLAEYTLPNAVDGATFELVLAPETSAYKMTVTCTMGGENVPVTVNTNGSVTISINRVSGDIVITADSRKSAYSITNGEGIANSNSDTSVAHGNAYSANITSSDPAKKLYSLSYTMGRKTVDVPVVDGAAAISIEAVTGDITITAVLVDKNLVGQWIFDVSKAVTGFGEWGDTAQTIAIAHNGYYDSKNADNNQPHCTTNVVPDLLSITTNLPTAAAGWADASTVIGYKLPADLELGATYIMRLPIYAGNKNTTMVSSRNKSTRSGMELVFTTVKPENMWNAGDKTVTRIYSDGAGVRAASIPSLGKLTTDSSNVFAISFTVTEKIREYAVSGNYLTLIINHQHNNGSYKIGNATLIKVTDPAKVSFDIKNCVSDGAQVAQKGDPYTAQIVAKSGYELVYVDYIMNGQAPVEVAIVDGVARVKIDQVTGYVDITAVTWKKDAGKKPPKLPVLGARPSPSPYNDYPYICDEEDNLMPNFGFESDTNYLENIYSKIETDADAWEGNNSLHYAPVAAEEQAGNLLLNGDFAEWNKTGKTISNWQFNNHRKLDKLEFVELDGRHAVKLVECSSKDEFNLEMMQRVYLEADFTYTFSFDFYGVAHWGPNLVIYDANLKNISTTNAKTTGTEGEWTTLSTTFRPTISGYYFFAVRIHNAAYPQKEQYVSNCAITLKSTRVEHELWNLKPNTNYWLTLFVKAAKVESVENSFLTFGMTVPETGNFIVMADPSSEGGRPYKTGQQLVPMAYDDQWHVLTVPFNTGDATRLNFTIDGLNCDVWFDNIYIFEEADAKPFVSPLTDKAEAVVTDTAPKLLGCEEDKNLFENHDLNDGKTFWGENSHKFGLFGNVLNVADSGSRVYGNALHYMAARPTSTYYIKWIDVEPNTEYTFFAKYAIAQAGDGFMGLINGYRMESEVTENRLFPTMIAQFGFGEENYLESRAWQTAAVSFNSGERNRIGFVICDAGGEAYIDELRLFKSSDGIALVDIEDTLPKSQSSAASKSAPAAPVAQQPANHSTVGVVLWTMTGALVAAAMISLIIIQKKRKNTH